jgi:hypothetical protein
MTIKDAMRLKVGQPVGLTRDNTTWYVAKVEPKARYVQIKQGDSELDLRGAAALRSLQHRTK